MKARSKSRTMQAPASANVVPSSPWRDCILLTIGVLLFCGIYFDKAYNIDDPLVVWTAKRIAAAPADFYGFEVNWYGFYAPMHLTDLNPPGAAYYTTIFGMLSHWREAAIHCAFALVAVALVIGIYWLARRMGSAPLQTAFFALVCPAIFVSMGTVMTDLLMIALSVWAILLWMRGLDKENPSLNAASGVLIGLAALSKYFAFSLIPLLIVYTLFYGRKRWIRMAWMLIPVAMGCLFELYTQELYGVGHIHGIVGLAEQYYDIHTTNYLSKLLTVMTFLGAGAAPALFLAPWLWRRAERKFLWRIGIVAAALTATILWQSGWQPGEPQVSYRWWFWLQYALWLLAGVHIVAVIIAELRAWRNRDAILLALWMGGTFFYCIFFNHLVNIRVLLPAFAVAALVCMRRFRRMQSERKDSAPAMLRFPVWGALAVGLALSLCAARADISLANSARTAAETIAPEKRSGRTWFSGHWGFQYYMEARGAKPIDRKNPDFRIGDAVVTPIRATNSNRIPLPPDVLEQLVPGALPTIEDIDVPVCSWLTTMQTECGAGFHADIWGPLPFVFGPVPAEQYQLIVLHQR